MDLVKIGFIIHADGLKDANKQVDDLLNKVDKISTQGKKSAADFETSQKKIKESSKEAAKEVDKTSKALEKQKIIGDYLGKGLDKATATSIANFKQLKASVVETNSMFTLLGNNSTLDKTNKQAKAITESLDKMRLNLDLVGKGFSASEQAQLRQLKLNGATNAQLEEAIGLIKKRRQETVLADYQNQKASLSREWMSAYDKEISSRVAKEQEAAEKIKRIRDTVNVYDTKSRQPFGGGILDQVERQNQGLSELRKQYTDEIKAINDKEDAEEKARQKKFSAAQDYYQQQMGLLAKETAAQKAAAQQSIDDAEKARQKKFAASQKEHQHNMELLEKERHKVKQANDERQKAITLEQAKAKYVSQGYGKTDSTRLARLEISGADVDTLTKYKDAIDSTRSSMRNFAPVSLTATKSNNTLLDSVKGIAAYALLSTAIYGTITALTDLAVSIVSTADEMTNLTQRLNIYLPANIKVNQVLERMGEIAKENRVTLSDTGKLFTQLLPPIQRIKGGVAETTAIVDAFGKAMLVGGANTMEAASATIQFGQAMASGKLAGDEFRSLAEASPRLLQAIADGAGIAAQKLKEMSAAGELNTPLISAALLDQMLILQYEAAQMGQTVSGAFNEGMVAYQLFVNEFNEQTGFTEGLVESIRAVVRSLEGFGKGFLASLKDGDSTLNSFLGLLRTVWDIVGAVVGGFTDVVGWIFKAGEKTGLWKAILDTTKLAIITIVDTLAKIPFVIVNIGTRIAELVLKPFEKFIELAQKGLDLAGFDSAAARLGQGLSNYRGFMGDIKGTTGEVITGFNLLSLGVDKTAESTGNVNDLLSKLKQKNQDLVIQEKEKKALTDQQAIDEYAKLLLQQNGVAVTAENLKLVKEELQEYYKITQEQAKQLKLDGEAQAKKDGAEAKAKKDAEKRKSDAEQDAKRIENNLKGYQDELDYIDRVLKYREKGVALDVAKIAAEKNYFEIWKNDAMAQTIIQAQKDLAKAEYLEDLKIESELLQRIQKIQDLGVSTDQARALAQAGFRADVEGVAAAAQLAHNELVNQSYVLADQVKQQNALNYYIDKGVKSEEAAISASFARLAWMQKSTGVVKDGLTEQQKKIKEAMLLQAKGLRTEQQNTALKLSTNSLLEQNNVIQKSITAETSAYTVALTKARLANMDASEEKLKDFVLTQSTNAALLRRQEVQLQLNNLVKGYTTEMTDFMNAYPILVDEDYKRTVHAEKLYKILKKQQEVVDKKKETPFGDFSKVDFNVFGDFGNPLEEALAGVNTYISKMVELKGELKTVRQAHLDAGIAAEESSLKSGVDSEEYKAAAANVTYLAKLEQTKLKEKQAAQEDAFASGLKFSKSFFKEESKGYKVVSALEQALQAKKIAFAIWEKKDTLQTIALKIVGYAKDLGMFLASVATKVAAQLGFNASAGVGAILSAAQQPGPAAFVGFAAMAALVAGLGIAFSGGGGSSGTVTPSNNGTGTVFGDKEAQSESIKKSIDLLAENSDLMLPINNAMLRALKNIESALGGVANLIIRGDIGNTFASGLEFDGKLTGVVGKLQSVSSEVASAFNFLDKFSGFDMGGLFNGIRSTILGGLFGKTSQAVTGSGLFAGSQSLGSVLDNGLNLQQYADVATTKKSWFSKSTSYSTQYGQVDQEIKNQFGLIFDGVFNSILTASSALGKDGNEVTQALRNSIINIGKIDTKGLTGEEIQKKLEAVISAQADTLAKNAVKGLDDFQKIGEGYFETLTRVAIGIEQAAYYTDQLGYTAINYTDIIAKQGDVASEIIRQSVLLNESTKTIKGGFYDMVNQFDGTAEELTDFVLTLRDLQDQLFMTGKNADYLTSSMILGAGGLDKLASGLDAYFEMLSPAEQAAELTRRLTKEFAIFGKELPPNVKSFRDLVNSITDAELATEAGQKLYGQIIALAPEFNDLQDSLDKANSEVNALVKSLRDLAEEARKARGETEQPRNLGYVRNQFQNDSILAMQGDTAAAERLLSLGKDLMSLSKQYSVSGSEYAKDLALIQRAATVSADVQEAGLGYAPSTTLSTALVSGANTSATINTNTSSTDAKLDALREDLNVALLAIAKYTQATATKLENWDDGDRMTVRIEQYGSNDKIPVSTA